MKKIPVRNLFFAACLILITGLVYRITPASSQEGTCPSEMYNGTPALSTNGGNHLVSQDGLSLHKTGAGKIHLKIIHYAPVKVSVVINGIDAGIYDNNSDVDVSQLVLPGVNKVKLIIDKIQECTIISSSSLEVSIVKKDGTTNTQLIKARFAGDMLKKFPDTRLLKYSFTI